MKKDPTFEGFWQNFAERPLAERAEYFRALPKEEQLALIQQFFREKWHELVVHNIVDARLDYIKQRFSIDLIDLRIQALMANKVFLVDKEVWQFIEDVMLEFEDFYDTNVIFGDLVVSDWGRSRQFCKVRRKTGT